MSRVGIQKLNFKVSSGLKDIIGKDLITNEYVAIFELVKNCFDANASNVLIDINSYKNRILIQDDGEGMSYDDLVNKWLFVAYSSKRDAENNKMYAGSKGIGRFSCDRLGQDLNLYSKKNGKSHLLKIHWGNFEKDTTVRFEELDITYEEISDEDNLVKSDSGVALEILNLREIWTQKRVDNISQALERLINPFEKNDQFEIYVRFTSDLNILVKEEKIENSILDILDSKTTYIDCSIKGQHIYIKLADSEKVIYELKLVNSTFLNEIDFKIYYLSSKAKQNFSRRMKIPAKNYGSIFLYKNNFRIFPFGEPDFDSFGLNLRKSQGYNRYLGHRELLGWINITDSENHFKEVTSRDRGFIENEYTINFEEIYISLVHRPLESYVNLVRFGEVDIEDVIADESISLEKKLISRFKKYEIIEKNVYELPVIAQAFEERVDVLTDPKVEKKVKNEVEKNIKLAMRETKKEVQEHKTKREKVEAESEALKKEIQIKNRIIENIQPDRQITLSHELGKISKDIKATLSMMNRKIDTKDKLKFSTFFMSLRRISDKLNSIKKTILKVNLDSQNEREKIEIKSFIKSYFDNAINDERVQINIRFDNKNIIREINIFDFGIVIDNIFLNAIELQATKIDIFSKGNEITIITDTGPITVEPCERIFDVGVTSKKNGTGIGMFLVKQIIEEFGWNITVTNLKNNYVEFKINTGEDLVI